MVKPTPVILTAGPPGTDPFSAIDLDGQYRLWGPFQLNGWELSTYDDPGDAPGTVITSGTSSLVKSSFTMGAGENLNIGGAMTLQHSQLEVDGGLIGHGYIVATQGSTITVDSSGAAPAPTTGPSPFSKVQMGGPPVPIILESSTLNIEPGSSYTGPVLMDSKSTINLGNQFTVPTGQAFVIDPLGYGTGTLNTNGVVISGTMIAGANFQQAGNSSTLIAGGRLELEGYELGGTIGITSGTLEFAPTPNFIGGTEISSENFHSALGFYGANGTLQFDGLKDLSIAFRQNAAIDHYSHGIPMHNADLVVFSHGAYAGNFQLLPGEQNYSAHEFSIHGNDIVFHQT